MSKFLGIPYPVRKHAQGFFHTQEGINQIKSDLLVLLLTNPGERVFLPAFGTPLRQLVFEPNDTGLESKARQMIVNSIQQWEPRVAVQQIEVTNLIDETSLNSSDDFTEIYNVLSIRIIFVDPENIREIQELKLEIPLAGA